MNKERTRNPHFTGTPVRRAWDEGYAAALRDAAGISSDPKSYDYVRNAQFPKLSFPW